MLTNNQYPQLPVQSVVYQQQTQNNQKPLTQQFQSPVQMKVISGQPSMVYQQQAGQSQMYTQPNQMYTQQNQMYTQSNQMYTQQNQHVKTIQQHHMHHTHEYKIPQYQQPIVTPPQQAIISTPQQPIVTPPPPQQPEINEMYHVERELQVLSVEEVEEPWKKKCVELEIKIFDLQTELARYKNQGQEIKVTSNEEFQIRELEAKIKMMKDIEDGLRKEIESQQNEIDSWRQRYSKLQLEFQQLLQGGEEVRQLRDALAEKERQILKLENALNSSNMEMQNYMRLVQNKDQEIAQYKQMIRQLEQEMSEYQSTTEKLKYYSNEADIWKERFMKANQDFHTAQEQWMMAQAELDSLKKQKTITTTEKTTTVQQSNTRSSKTAGRQY
ncbi:unnamed protein product [Paramecium sonneborni]|uniref:Uncharacterized protein n=1 Tax=Paramecium sonneborni TaxID=65129 RepID=A0A8S1QR78_9CILI|nr:unnamed protein product [Paramecium sonneborni]